MPPFFIRAAMASVVDIANLALARLGDDATISSLNPPEGSAQAEHCARFYPMARDMMLAWPDADWSFANARINLAPVASSVSTWDYAYAVPSNMLKAVAVLDPDAEDDYSMPVGANLPGIGRPLNSTTQPYTIETLNGASVIYTNQANALLRYIVRIEDATKFPPLFVDALVWLLASHIAGPILKGDSGASASNSCYQAFMSALNRAMAADATQRKVVINHVVPWIADR